MSYNFKFSIPNPTRLMIIKEVRKRVAVLPLLLSKIIVYIAVSADFRKVEKLLRKFIFIGGHRKDKLDV